MLNGVGEAAGELIHEYRHLSGHIIQQLEAATIFGAFLTGDALKRLSFQLQRQAPAPGAVGDPIDRVPELVIAGVKMAPFTQPIAQRAEDVAAVADPVNVMNVATRRH